MTTSAEFCRRVNALVPRLRAAPTQRVTLRVTEAGRTESRTVTFAEALSTTDGVLTWQQECATNPTPLAALEVTEDGRVYLSVLAQLEQASGASSAGVGRLAGGLAGGLVIGGVFAWVFWG